MIGEVGGGLGHVATVAGRADAAALAGEGHDESRAARHADRTAEPEAEDAAPKKPESFCWPSSPICRPRRCANILLDIGSRRGKARFHELLATADVLIDGRIAPAVEFRRGQKMTMYCAWIAVPVNPAR